MKFDLKHVPKAKNLDQIGWSGGYMLVQFKGRPTRYVFGPNIPETEFDKILGTRTLTGCSPPTFATSSSATRSETDEDLRRK